MIALGCKNSDDFIKNLKRNSNFAMLCNTHFSKSLSNLDKFCQDIFYESVTEHLISNFNSYHYEMFLKLLVLFCFIITG